MVDLFEQKLVLREFLWLLCLDLRAELIQLNLHTLSLLLDQLGEVLFRILHSLFHLLPDHASKILLSEKLLEDLFEDDFKRWLLALTDNLGAIELERILLERDGQVLNEPPFLLFLLQLLYLVREFLDYRAGLLESNQFRVDVRN